MSSDNEEVVEDEAISSLAVEVKEIRNSLISLKKSVNRGDKKQKKVIQEEVDVLEIKLQEKLTELKRLKEQPALLAQEASAELEEQAAAERALKLRGKKERKREEREAAVEADRQAAREEVASRPDLALIESQAFNHRLLEEGFRIVEVAADGHCMYSAIGCQLDPPLDHWDLRRMAADHLQSHQADFEHFIDYEEIGSFGKGHSPNDGEGKSFPTPEADRFVVYCEKVRSTALWGGQIELQALSQALGRCIIVLQSDGPKLAFSEDSSSFAPVYLSFHKHAFSLGEHYNALIKE